MINHYVSAMIYKAKCRENSAQVCCICALKSHDDC